MLSEAVTDPEVLALANLNIFADIPFFLLGRLIYLFALDRFHLKMRGLENLPEKGPFHLCSNHQSYVDPLGMAGMLPWRLVPYAVALGTNDIFGKVFILRLCRCIALVGPAAEADADAAMHGRR